MGKEIVDVPIIFLAGYGIFVVVATVLVGVLPPLVNRPLCNENGRPYGRVVDPVLNDVVVDVKQDLPEPALPLMKQQAKNDKARDVLAEKKAYYIENIEPKIRDLPYFERFGLKFNAKVDFPACPEIANPQTGVTYPWNSPRLPAYLSPLNYQLTLFLNDFGRDVYTGEIIMTFDVTQANNNYILVHSAENDIPVIEYLQDRNGANVAINCAGEYQKDRTDYIVIKTEQNLQPTNGPYKLKFSFADYSLEVERGIFKLNYGQSSSLIASKFEPIDARRAYPMFDEPGLKATYDVTIYHRNDHYVLSNAAVKQFSETTQFDRTSMTVFQQTPKMPPSYMAYFSFSKNDFNKVTTQVNTLNGPIDINLWARKEFISAGFTREPLNLIEKIYMGLLDIFRDVNPSAIPAKIDVFATPDYPVDEISHFGLPVIKDSLLMYKNLTATEKDEQRTGLIIAKTLSQFWFGNYLTASWWDQLWIPEGFSDYIQYRGLEEFVGEWNVLDEFITEELITTLISDGYPTSHPISKPITNPYEIEEYFDEIESSKTAAILRWVEDQFNLAKMYSAITALLNANPWGTADMNVFYQSIGTIGTKNWPAKDFFDRWTQQSNFPLVYAEIVAGTPQQVRLTQTRALNRNDSIYSGNQFPSPFDYIWYIPVSCMVGVSPTSDTFRIYTFYLDQRTETFNISVAQTWTWINCDREFIGYYELQYTEDNWRTLEKALENEQILFEAEDRASIYHNLFLNAYAERGSYYLVADFARALEKERDYLPWRTVYIHLRNIAGILEYKQTFYQISQFFSFILRFVERDIDIWTPSEFHVENLLKETLGSLACYLQDNVCIDKVAELWETVKNDLQNGNVENSAVPAYAREIVYNYHIQNTYDVNEWDVLLFDFENTLDEAEQRKLLEALSFTRQPWLLIRMQEDEQYFTRVDFFDIFRLLSQNTVGREQAWSYYRVNHYEIIEEYSLDDPRIGRMLLDIVKTFENEFLFYELLEFVFYIVDGATVNARVKALELASTNIVWLFDKEAEVRDAFSLNRLNGQGTSANVNPLLEVNTNVYKKQEFLRNAREAFLKKLRETDLNVFAELKQKLI